MNRKKMAIAIGLLFIILVGFFIYKERNESSDNSSKNNIVRIGYLNIISHIPLMIAREKDLFSQKGIVIETTVFQSSNQIYEAILRDDIDFAPNMSSIPILQGELIDPEKIKIFAPSDYTSDKPFDVILARKDSLINSIWDLPGKKVGVFPGTTSKNYIKKLLKDNDIDSSQIEFVELPQSIQLTTLYSGGVDVIHSYEPNNAIALASGNAKMIFGSAQAAALEHNPFAVGAISKKFVDENPETAKKAVEVIHEANSLMKGNENETRETAKNIFKLDDESAKTFVIPEAGPWTEENISTFKKFVDIAIEMGELKAKPEINNMIYR